WIFNNHMERAITTFLLSRNIIFFFDNDEIFSGPEHFYNRINIIDKLANHSYTGNILDFFLNLFKWYLFFLCLFQNTFDWFHSPSNKLNRRMSRLMLIL